MHLWPLILNRCWHKGLGENVEERTSSGAWRHRHWQMVAHTSWPTGSPALPECGPPQCRAIISRVLASQPVRESAILPAAAAAQLRSLTPFYCRRRGSPSSKQRERECVASLISLLLRLLVFSQVASERKALREREKENPLAGARRAIFSGSKCPRSAARAERIP